jgi:ATP-binding cassette subfamily B protein
VANQPIGAIQRTFANRDLFSGPARRAVIWSIFAAVWLAAVLVTIGLIVGLLTERGQLRVRLTPDELKEFNRFTGMALIDIDPLPAGAPPAQEPAAPTGEDAAAQAPAENAADALPASEQGTDHQVDGEGILGSVWRSHGTWYGPAFAWLYRRTDWLKHNDFALVTLLLAGALGWLLRYWCLNQIVHQSRVAALRVAVMFRNNLHRQALRLSPEDIDEHSAQVANQLFTTQVDAVRHGLEIWIHDLARYPLEIACAVVIACHVDPLLTVQWGVPLILCWFLIERSQAKLAAARRLRDDRLRNEYHALSDQLSNARLVRGFGMEQAEHEEFAKRLERTLTPALDLSASQREAQWLHRLTILVCVGLLLFMLLFLGLKLLHSTGELTWSGAIVFGLAVTIALRGCRQLWNLRTIREEISLAASQIFRYLDRLPSVSQAVGAKFLQPLSRTLHFDAVTYRAPSQQLLLDRVTLKLEARKSYAVVSLDPLDARAFALLLPRFIEPQSGRVLFDGEDIAWATLESLRAEAVFVGSDDPPLRGTVLDNLRAGNPQYTLPQVTEAAKTVHAHNFLVKLAQGYETVLSGGDGELDASQRYRLSLARALLRNPALLIVEEPRVHLDDDTKQLLDDAFPRITSGRTVIFLPARMSTLKRVDQILLLNDGQVAAQGSQAELVSESPLYRHWEYLHFNEFRRQELAAAGG